MLASPSDRHRLWPELWGSLREAKREFGEGISGPFPLREISKGNGPERTALFKRDRDPAKSLDAELTTLLRRRADVEERLAAAASAVDVANGERRRLLLEADAVDNSAIDRTEAACVAAASRLAGLEDAARALAEKVADSEQRLADHRDRAERERVAADLERRANAVDAGVAELVDALEGVADAHRNLTATIGIEGVRTTTFGIEPSAANIATQILAAGLSTALPGLRAHITFRCADDPEPRSAEAVARELQGDVMRAVAGNIRQGAAPATIPDSVSTAPHQVTVEIPETTLVVQEPIQWHGPDGRLVQAPHFGVSIPVPVAEAAIAMGIGFPPDSAEAIAIMREAQGPEPPDYAKNQRTTVVRRHPPWTDVGVNLHAHVEAERQRLAERAAA